MSNEFYEKLDNICALAIKDSFMPFEIAKDVDFISDELKKMEKSLQALEIIKNKEVDITVLKTRTEYADYNQWFNEKYHLTETEFNILKEILE